MLKENIHIGTAVKIPGGGSNDTTYQPLQMSKPGTL